MTATPTSEHLTSREGELADVATSPISSGEVRRRAAAGVVLLGIRGIGIRLFSFVGNVVLARLLVPEDFGVVALGLTVIQLGTFLSEAGIGAALIRRREEPERGDFASVVGFQLAVTSAIAIGALAVGLPLGRTATIVGIMAAGLPFTSFRAPGFIYFERNLIFRPVVTVELLESLVFYSWAIVTVALGADVWGFATAAIARTVMGAVTMMTVSPLGFVAPRFSWARVKRLLGFGVRYQGIAVVTFLRDAGLNVGIAAIAGVATLGIWALAYRVLQVPGLLFESLWRVSFPTMSKLLAAGEDPRPLLERGGSRTAIAAGLIACPLAGSAPALIPSVFGSNWSAAIDVLPFACIGIVTGGPASVATAGYFFATDDASTVLRSHALGLVAWQATAFGLLTPLGTTALGLGMMVGSLVDAGVLVGVAQRRTGARLVWPIALPTLIGAAAAAAGWLLASAADPTLLLALSSAALSAAIYAALAIAIAREAVRETLGMVRGALRSAVSPGPA